MVSNIYAFHVPTCAASYNKAGAELTPVHGPRRVGLVNMGNTCYVNSVLQVLKAGIVVVHSSPHSYQQPSLDYFDPLTHQWQASTRHLLSILSSHEPRV